MRIKGGGPITSTSLVLGAFGVASAGIAIGLAVGAAYYYSTHQNLGGDLIKELNQNELMQINGGFLVSSTTATVIYLVAGLGGIALGAYVGYNKAAR